MKIKIKKLIIFFSIISIILTISIKSYGFILDVNTDEDYKYSGLPPVLATYYKLVDLGYSPSPPPQGAVIDSALENMYYQTYGYGFNQPFSYGWDQPPGYGWNQPSYDWSQPSFGWNQPSYGFNQPYNYSWNQPYTSEWNSPYNSRWNQPDGYGYQQPFNPYSYQQSYNPSSSHGQYWDPGLNSWMVPGYPGNEYKQIYGNSLYNAYPSPYGPSGLGYNYVGFPPPTIGEPCRY